MKSSRQLLHRSSGTEILAQGIVENEGSRPRVISSAILFQGTSFVVNQAVFQTAGTNFDHPSISLTGIDSKIKREWRKVQRPVESLDNQHHLLKSYNSQRAKKKTNFTTSAEGEAE